MLTDQIVPVYEFTMWFVILVPTDERHIFIKSKFEVKLSYSLLNIKRKDNTCQNPLYKSNLFDVCVDILNMGPVLFDGS